MPPLNYILQGLRQPLPGPNRVSGANNAAELDVLQGALGDEFRTRSRMEQGLGELGFANQANKYAGLASDYESDRQNSTVGRQAPLTQSFETNNYGAASEGFGAFGQGVGGEGTSEGQNPLQSREIYRRKFEQEKMRQPERTNAATNAADIQRQRIQSQGLVDQADALGRNRSEMGNALIDLFGSGGMPAGSSISFPGGGSVRVPGVDATPNGAFTALTKARQEYNYAKQNAPGRMGKIAGFFGLGGPDRIGPAKAALDDAALGYIGQLDPNIYSPQITNFAWEAYQDPDNENLSTDEIAQIVRQQAPDVDADELNAFVTVLRTLKGR